MMARQTGLGKKVFAVLVCAAFVIGGADDAFAAKKKKKTKKRKSPARAAVQKTPAYNPRYAALVIDLDTGKVLHEDRADELRYPASLTKMMTLYLTFEALREGRIRMGTDLPVSYEAASQPQTNLSLEPGDEISVRDAIDGLIIRSANDASVVIAEKLAGSEEEFAEEMTRKARELGMSRTTFRNANGLPNPTQRTTAYDMATLGKALKRDFPEYFPMFKKSEFYFNGVKYSSHNRVTRFYPGADGIKTGFIGASGFNLVTTASREGHNLIGVVLGGPSGSWRDSRMMALLNQQFAKLKAGGDDNVAYTASDKQPKVVALRQAEVKPLSTQLSGPEEEQVKPLAETARAGWVVQLGVFEEQKAAMQAISRARIIAGLELHGASVDVQKSGKSREGVHRARLKHLTAQEAKAACQKLWRRGASCFAAPDAS
ncbi:MAG: D-alanyl-D-alanine carboxypeptidase [Alphaproteobacteria bacterium]|nr:D-alanyl-D-alanine carboxypeptidase [Alphaproteobacteria bacterium]